MTTGSDHEKAALPVKDHRKELWCAVFRENTMNGSINAADCAAEAVRLFDQFFKETE